MALVKRGNTPTPEGFLARQPAQQIRADGMRLLRVFREVTTQPGTLKHAELVSFGVYTFQFEGSKPSEQIEIGFRIGKNGFILQLDFDIAKHADLLAQLEGYRLGPQTLTIKYFDEASELVVRELITRTLARCGK